MLREMDLNKFTDDLSSEKPAPGGGSVAGLAASLGASLAAMVFNLTIDNKVSENYDEALKEKLKRAREDAINYKNVFLELVEEDTKYFTEFMDALKMPKETEEEKAVRREKLDRAKKLILDTPLKMAMEAAKLYDIIDFCEEFGNQGAVSDAGVAALMVDSAIKSSLLNVKINLPMVKDEERKAEVIKYIEDLTNITNERSSKIYNSVSKKLD